MTSAGSIFLPSFRLDGRQAIVTGASQGLGRHIALALAEAGADLALVGRSLGSLESVAAEAHAMGRLAVCVTADLSQIDEVRKMTAQIAEVLGRIDILVNNAGTNIQQLAVDVTEEAWDTVMNINLKGAFFTAREVGLRMIAQGGGGRIVNIASQMAAVGFYKRSAYCASKAAVAAFTKVLALEWAAEGIRVNAVGPTFIDSPLARKVFEDKEIHAAVLQRLPIGRLGRMEEVAAAVVYLVSDGADLVTGHTLMVDGGWTAQ
ncbi:SDR family NAD(P)-dependent oxidoreductase [Bradyrhizobium cajani]|uniref:Glucose 1-dehydrogenase n=1 Tax=Bradyrhizobium cajani TaxID=1928661 RepID=A0A844TM20_9BRAD|nr:glucose 1-dehydrogenase [Bradyrhizobium cajani]MCP3371818.1 glucose 1-dehydrogenase [Bradyrhizobium cajani]MVT76362.1 glucose 1-dehydrogenase [Bradyrhizobium cajani]